MMLIEGKVIEEENMIDQGETSMMDMKKDIKVDTVIENTRENSIIRNETVGIGLIIILEEKITEMEEIDMKTEEEEDFNKFLVFYRQS